MNASKIIVIAGSLLVTTQTANAGTQLGVSVNLPLLEGGLLGVAAAALVVGVRIIRAKSKR